MRWVIAAHQRREGKDNRASFIITGFIDIFSLNAIRANRVAVINIELEFIDSVNAFGSIADQ
jgi:hypothetical protein